MNKVERILISNIGKITVVLHDCILLSVDIFHIISSCKVITALIKLLDEPIAVVSHTFVIKLDIGTYLIC